MQKSFDHIFADFDSPLPIDSDEIITRLQMWFNSPQSGHEEGQKLPFFGEIRRVLHRYVVFNRPDVAVAVLKHL